MRFELTNFEKPKYTTNKLVAKQRNYFPILKSKNRTLVYCWRSRIRINGKTDTVLLTLIFTVSHQLLLATTTLIYFAQKVKQVY